jgi:exonuclease III
MSTVPATGKLAEKPLTVFPYSCGCTVGGCLSGNSRCGCIKKGLKCNLGCKCCSSSKCLNKPQTHSVSESFNTDHSVPTKFSTNPLSSGVTEVTSSFTVDNCSVCEPVSEVSSALHPLSCVTFNINGIYKRTEQVVNILKNKNISFLGLQELRVESHDSPQFLSFSRKDTSFGYSIIFNGNVALIYHNSFTFIQDSLFKDSKDRVIGATFSKNKTLYKVASVYAPTAPRKNLKDYVAFWNSFKHILTKSKYLTANSIIMGDYNTDVSTETRKQWFTTFEQVYLSTGLVFTTPVPSRIYRSSADSITSRCLDYFSISKHLDKYRPTVTLKLEWIGRSDHIPLLLAFNININLSLHNSLSTNYINRRLSQNQKDIFSNNPHWFTAPNLSSSDSIDDYDEKLRKWILEGTSVLPQKGDSFFFSSKSYSFSDSRLHNLNPRVPYDS